MYSCFRIPISADYLWCCTNLYSAAYCMFYIWVWDYCLKRDSSLITQLNSLHHFNVYVVLTVLFRPFIFHAMKTIKLFGFPIFRLWAYPMRIIEETRRAHQILYVFIVVITYLSNSECTFFQQIICIPMETSCAPLLVDPFLYS